MEYWSTVITQKSWEILQQIRKKIDFVLIGGWAAYLWVKDHKSKDIDIVIDFDELAKLKKNYTVNKNDALKKYEIKIEGIDIDIYVPFYSKLPLISKLKDYTAKVEGFNVIMPEALVVLKQAAEIERGYSEKGLKDRIDVMDLLLKCEIDFNEYINILEKEKLRNFKARLIEIITNFHETKYIGLNPRQFKLKKEELLSRLKK